MSQLKLFETPLHRERDRPKSIKTAHWSAWIDKVVVRGGVQPTRESLLRNFHECCPEFKASVHALSDLDTVHLSHWEWYWDRWNPWIKERAGS